MIPRGFSMRVTVTRIRPYLIGVISERELDLVTVAPAAAPKAGPGRGHSKPVSTGLTGLSKADEVTAARLRAIAERAPEPAPMRMRHVRITVVRTQGPS